MIQHIDKVAARPLNLMTIGQLMGKFDPNHRNSDEVVIQNARWVLEEIPVRLAHRLRDFHRLPYVMLSCESLGHVHNTYLNSFDRLSAFPEIKTEEQALLFCNELRGALRQHRDIVMRMKHGVAELRSFDGLHHNLSVFLDKLFVTRIGNRVLAEHFLAWSDKSESEGIVTECRLARVIGDVAGSVRRLVTDIYGHCPDIRVEGQLDTVIPIIPEHLEYITREIIKNAVRATVDAHTGPNYPVVTIGIYQGKYDVLIKVSDRGGGFDKKVAKRIWDYGFTTARDLQKEKAAPGASPMDQGTLSDQQKLQIAGFGVGLPLSRLYARYFGGDVHMSQMYGHGTDVFINLNRLGNHTELDVSSDEEAEERQRSAARAITRNADRA
jgi:signal transduction histidine kinase